MNVGRKEGGGRREGGRDAFKTSTHIEEWWGREGGEVRRRRTGKSTIAEIEPKVALSMGWEIVEISEGKMSKLA